jgi:hypothetical protein
MVWERSKLLFREEAPAPIYFAGTAPSMTVLSCWAQEEDAMSIAKKPLKPADFPVTAEGQKIKKQDGKPIASTEDADLAADVAERLNDEEARREEDKWSA